MNEADGDTYCILLVMRTDDLSRDDSIEASRGCPRILGGYSSIDDMIGGMSLRGMKIMYLKFTQR